MQAGQSKPKTVNSNNYASTSDLLFTIASSSEGNVYCGSKYLYSYQAGSDCGPVHGNGSDKGTTIVWTAMSNNTYWNIHGKYSFLGTKYAALYYTGSKYDAAANVWGSKETHTDAEYQWYLVSQAQYDRHWAIYLYDRYKESISDYTKWENLVPAAYYTALADAYAVTYSVKNTAHSKEVVNAHRADLKALYDNAEALADAYANAKAAIDALEAVEDKGEDFSEVTNDITNARTALEAAMTVDAVNASVAGLKAIDPITFTQTEFEALSFVTNAASTAAGRVISYAAENKSVINAEGKAIYAGTTTLTATAAATNQYYKFVRSAQVTVTAWETFGEFEQTTCDEAVEFNNQTYEESFAGDVNVGKNYIGGDSTVHVNIVINHATFGTDTKTIVYGDEEEWNGIALKDSTVGVHSVVYVTTNAVGCDSTVTLTLTVNKIETLRVDTAFAFCAGGSETFHGKIYTEAVEADEIQAEGATRDTVYVVNVTVNQPSYTAAEMQIYVGDNEEWNGIALKDSTVGVHTVVYTTENAVGCDSIVTLTLTVLALPTTYGEYNASMCPGDSVEFAGVWYYDAVQKDITLDEKNIYGGDSIVSLTVTVLPVDFVELNTDSLHVGDTLFLGDGLWYLVGDELELLTDTAYVMEEERLFDITMTATNEFGCDSVIVRHVVVEKKQEDTPATGLDNVEKAAEAVKELRNGVLYIRRNDALYTTEGRRVE